MKKITMSSWSKWLIISSVVVFAIIISLLVVLAFVYSGEKTTSDSVLSSSSSSSEVNAESCVGDDCLSVEDLEYPVSDLPEEAAAAIDRAIDDEYKAYSAYSAVISKLGQIRPFSMIIRAEESHIALLKSIFDKYGQRIPANPYEGTIVVADNKQLNCQIGKQAEIENAALYRDELLSKVSKYPDITEVFNKLMSDSEDKHLPAFDKCD